MVSIMLFGAFAEYRFPPRKTTIRVEIVDCRNDRQLTLF